MRIEFGHVPDLDTAGTGWFIGSGDWTGSSLRHVFEDQNLRGLCVKWMSHAKGDPRGINKPISDGNSVSMLVTTVGSFRLEFSEDPTFQTGVIQHRFTRQGDFSAWGAGIHHRWFVDEDSTILTIRWSSQER